MLTAPSMNELTGQILAMAQTGIYRESLFETFRSEANKKQISAAIALAKQFGLRSDPTLRDSELGTYYQVDIDRVAAFQKAIEDSAKSGIVLSAGENMAERLQSAVQTVRLMLVAAQIGMITLILIGGGYLITGQSESAAIWWTSALCVSGLWLCQKTIAKPLL